jgi:mannose-6-phosphate isomerase-like protein (cupin superfamily)
MRVIMPIIYNDLIDVAKENQNYRQEIVTGKHSQIVLMSLKPGEEIGSEVHPADQILFIVSGNAKSVINGKEKNVKAGDIVFVPEGARHNFIDIGPEELKIITIYSPPQHKPGTIEKTKEESKAY